MIFEPKINNFVRLKTDDELFERLQDCLALLHESLPALGKCVPVVMARSAFRTARELESRGYDLLALSVADDTKVWIAAFENLRNARW